MVRVARRKKIVRDEELEIILEMEMKAKPTFRSFLKRFVLVSIAILVDKVVHSESRLRSRDPCVVFVSIQKTTFPWIPVLLDIPIFAILPCTVHLDVNVELSNWFRRGRHLHPLPCRRCWMSLRDHFVPSAFPNRYETNDSAAVENTFCKWPLVPIPIPHYFPYPKKQIFHSCVSCSFESIIHNGPVHDFVPIHGVYQNEVQTMIRVVEYQLGE
mmetsp:Transcript_905/g.2192  ORF Transcript_905/g.2192 Transcript_905/m.2192 type:complete len:214 (-) Transcript_905:4-645(-)